MKVLALDIATKTGWKSPNASGVWNLKTNKGESPGMKHLRFRKLVQEIVELEGIDMIAYEKPSGRFIKAVSSVSELVGILLAFCAESGLEHTGFTVSEIKKHATGKGNANKEAMIASAEVKWCDTKIIDDNHADALWIYDLALDRFA